MLPPWGTLTRQFAARLQEDSEVGCPPLAAVAPDMLPARLLLSLCIQKQAPPKWRQGPFHPVNWGALRGRHS